MAGTRHDRSRSEPLIAAMGGRIWARRRAGGGAEFGFALRVMGDDG